VLAAQQERRQPMPRAHQIRAQILAAANQVAQLLLRGRWDPDQLQVAGGEQPREADRVALVGLDPIVLLRHQRRRHHVAANTEAIQQPMEFVAGRAGLVTGPHLRAVLEAADQLAH
jgi:hypothetical protein